MDALPTIQEVKVMGGSVEKSVKKITKGSLIGAGGFADPNLGFKKKLRTKSSQIVEKPFRKGTTSKSRDASNLAAAQLDKQQKAELLRKAESEDEIARRRGLASSKGAGRRSLIRTAPTGLAQTLGG